ncbi:hypothetical protein [Streptomyces sp. NPDC095817]|uniref:hypothetical protein n=1 Tax=Streptomyces sp. NPDC095817 TaxID=3155082 RepID=UPI003333202A
MTAPARRRKRAADEDDWQPGLVPAPGLLLDWRHHRHWDRWQERPCALCRRPTYMRSHVGEAAHKTCAEAWISNHPAEARKGRFASDKTKSSNSTDDHA